MPPEEMKIIKARLEGMTEKYRAQQMVAGLSSQRRMPEWNRS